MGGRSSRRSDDDGKPAQDAAGERVMLKRIWLTPPLGFGRVGGSPTPSDAFMWGHSDLTPQGSGLPPLALAERFNLDRNGVPTRVESDRILFRDRQGIRPVCPYYDFHGT